MCDVLLPLSEISIHALREESDGYSVHKNRQLRPISIHALREESDVTQGAVAPPSKFQSTLSVRRATVGDVDGRVVDDDFNPRSP